MDAGEGTQRALGSGGAGLGRRFSVWPPCGLGKPLNVSEAQVLHLCHGGAGLALLICWKG